MEGQESSGDQESSEAEDTQQPEEEQEPVAPVKEEDDKPAKSDQPPEDSAEAGEGESDSDSPEKTDEVVKDEPEPEKQDEDKTDTSEDGEKEEPETVQEQPEEAAAEEPAPVEEEPKAEEKVEDEEVKVPEPEEAVEEAPAEEEPEPTQPEPEAEPVEDVQAAEETVDEAEQGDTEEAAPADAEPKAEPEPAAEPEEEEPQFDKGIFAIKTSIGHEKMVADTLEGRIRRRKADVYSIMLPPNLRGYLLIEALDNREALRDLIKGVQHARTIVEGTTTIEEIEGFLTPKPIVAGIEEGDIVEVIAGPFKGEKAKVKQIDISKEEITIELFEAMVSIPVTIRGDHVRVLEKESS